MRFSDSWGRTVGTTTSGPDSIVAWLRALERDHPFVLTGIGFDWVEGRLYCWWD